FLRRSLLFPTRRSSDLRHRDRDNKRVAHSPFPARFAPSSSSPGGSSFSVLAVRCGRFAPGGASRRGAAPRLVVSSSFRCRHGVGAVLFVTQPSRPLDSLVATLSLCWTGAGGVRRRRLDTRAPRVPVSCSGRCAQR